MKPPELPQTKILLEPMNCKFKKGCFRHKTGKAKTPTFRYDDDCFDPKEIKCAFHNKRG